MTNKERFLSLVSPVDSEMVREILFRKENKSWLRESMRIAVKVLLALKEQDMTQKELAEKMNVSPQYISKLVKGKENLTLETLTKLQNILGIDILGSTVEYKSEKNMSIQTGEGTIFNQFFLPTINVTELSKEDIQIPFE
jgi:transcriptional regulator with XRE-family HTH domain